MTADGRTWVLFAAGPGVSAGRFLNTGRANLYRVESVAGNAGGISPGWEMLRVESEWPLEEPTAGDVISFRGAIQHLQYTSETQLADLNARSRAELPPSSDTTAVLIPIRKSAAWWQQAHDRRAAHFHTSEGHTAIGGRYAERVFRRLYHSRYLAPRPYDFLTYFEFHASERDAFRALLAELRDPLLNPEWGFVEAEFEVWMTKVT